MNQKYKDKFDELRNNDLGTKQSNDNADQKEEDTYATPGNVRNIGFVWEDGSKVFFNYAYLISAKLESTNEQNLITLIFTTDVVTISGFKLDKIYRDVFTQKLRNIFEVNGRYNNLNSETYRVKITTKPRQS